EEGGVSLITEYDNGVLTLVVEDTGTGMTEEEQKQAFGAFERLSNAAVHTKGTVLLVCSQCVDTLVFVLKHAEGMSLR
ncbi:MAG: ATP-binding protein, partial [Sodaliphilus sp.]|nr:ATP-binding protein [Sodaliphilus sp.]